jgi:hypothetical protein
MPKIVTVTTYQFDELDDDAKERAREWWREGAFDDDWWYETTFEDFEQICKLIGVELQTHPVQLMGGGSRQKPSIWFSGFCYQGDGACFEGWYAYEKGAAKKIREYAPLDTELHRIVDDLQSLQRRHFYQLTATITHSGRYNHAWSVTIDVRRGDDYVPEKVEEDLAESLRDLMNWLYRALEREWDYQNSDEVVDETIRANEYEFTEEGERHVTI